MTTLDTLHRAAPAIPRTVWEGYVDRYGDANATRLATRSAYLTLLNTVYILNQNSGGIHPLLDELATHIQRQGGHVRRAINEWQEAISGELRVVDLALGRRVTIPPRWLSGLQGQLEVGEGGGRPGSQFDNWSTWSVRALLLTQEGSARGNPPRKGGWGDRDGFHPQFVIGGADNQINHFALALRLYAHYRLPRWALVGPVPPQDPIDTADGAVTTAAYWFLHGYRGRKQTIPARDVRAIQHVLSEGLAPFA